MNKRKKRREIRIGLSTLQIPEIEKWSEPFHYRWERDNGFSEEAKFERERNISVARNDKKQLKNSIP